MTAIISRSPESATQATPAARDRKAEKPAVSVLPTAPGLTPPTAEAADWRRPARTELARIADFLVQIEEPPAGWIATDTPAELISHAARRVKDLLRQEDGEEAWASSNTMWDAILWPFESLRAALELGALRGWAASTPEAFGLLTAANDKLTALQEYVAKQPVCTSKPFQDKPRPPIRRAPTAEALDAAMAEAISDQAVRTTLLVDWCLKARGVLDHIASAAQGDSVFRNALMEHEIAFRNASWTDCRMGECLEDVLHQQSNLIRQIAGGAA